AGPAFEEAVGDVAVGRDASGPKLALLPVPLPALWVRELVRRDDGEGLWSFLEPRTQALFAQVRAYTPLGPGVERLEWACWLDDPSALELWGQAAARRPERVADFVAALSERRRWDRFWALAARDRWSVGRLVAHLPEGARAAWFAMWQQPSPND